MAGATGGSRFHSAAALMALFLALTGLIAADATLESVATGGPLLMRRSLATDDECASEIAACEADTSCLACNTAFFAKYDECTSGSFSIPCEEFQGDFCCALADENEDCENDSAFTNVIECTHEATNPQCDDYTVDISNCNGAIGRATAWGLPSTLISAAVGALLVAAFGSSAV